MATLVPPVRHPGLRRVGLAFRFFLIAGLIAFTAWQGLLARPALQDARDAFARKDYLTTLRLAQDDLSRFPNSRASKLLIARALSLTLYADEAEPFYRDAATAAPLTLPELQDRAQGLIMSNQPDRAIAACHAILEQYPTDAVSLRLLATIEFARNQTVQAIAAAERLSHTAEGRATGFALLRDIYHEARKFDRAATAGEELLKLDPRLTALRYDHATFWSELGEDLLQADRPEVAKTLLSKAVDEHPNAELLDLLATAHFRLEEIDDAERVWRRAAAIDSRRVNPPYRLGHIEIGRQRYAEAVELFEKAMANDPSKIEPTYNLARAYRFLGRTADADRLDRRVAELRQTTPQTGGMGPTP